MPQNPQKFSPAAGQVPRFLNVMVLFQRIRSASSLVVRGAEGVLSVWYTSSRRSKNKKFQCKTIKSKKNPLRGGALEIFPPLFSNHPVQGGEIFQGGGNISRNSVDYVSRERILGGEPISTKNTQIFFSRFPPDFFGEKILRKIISP